MIKSCPANTNSRDEEEKSEVLWSTAFEGTWGGRCGTCEGYVRMDMSYCGLVSSSGDVNRASMIL